MNVINMYGLPGTMRCGQFVDIGFMCWCLGLLTSQQLRLRPVSDALARDRFVHALFETPEPVPYFSNVNSRYQFELHV